MLKSHCLIAKVTTQIVTPKFRAAEIPSESARKIPPLFYSCNNLVYQLYVICKIIKRGIEYRVSSPTLI